MELRDPGERARFTRGSLRANAVAHHCDRVAADAPSASVGTGLLHDRADVYFRMTLRIVRLGSPRAADEGLRVGTVRRPPRGVPRHKFGSGNWYDVWYPELSPSAKMVKVGLGARTAAEWAVFVRDFKREMASPPARRTLDLLAALSHSANFSIGCYCENESRCHRSVLRELLSVRGAKVLP